MPKERVRVVYVTEGQVSAIRAQLTLAASEFMAARDNRSVAAEELGLRRAALIGCIDRLKAALLDDEPVPRARPR